MVAPATQECLKFLAAMAVEYSNTLSPAVQETVLMRIQASHKHLVGALSSRDAAAADDRDRVPDGSDSH